MAAGRETGSSNSIRERFGKWSAAFSGAFLLLYAAVHAPSAQADSVALVNQFPFSVPWDSGPLAVRIFGLIPTADGTVTLTGRSNTAQAFASLIDGKFEAEWPAQNATRWPDDVANVQVGGASEEKGAWAQVDREFSAWP